MTEKQLYKLNAFPKDFQNAFLENDYFPESSYDANAFLKSYFNYDSNERIVKTTKLKDDEIIFELNEGSYINGFSKMIWKSLDTSERMRIIKWLIKDLSNQLNLKDINVLFAPTNLDEYDTLLGYGDRDNKSLFVNVKNIENPIQLISTVRHELEHFKQYREADKIEKSDKKPTDFHIQLLVKGTTLLSQVFAEKSSALRFLDKEFKEDYQKVCEDEDFISFIDSIYYTNGNELSANKKAEKMLKNLSNSFKFEYTGNKKDYKISSKNSILKNIEEENYEQFIPWAKEHSELIPVALKLNYYLNFCYQGKCAKEDLLDAYAEKVDDLEREVYRYQNDSQKLKKINKKVNNLIEKINVTSDELTYFNYKFRRCVNYLFEIYITNKIPYIEDDFFKEFESYDALMDNELVC